MEYRFQDEDQMKERGLPVFVYFPEMTQLFEAI
jgi:hypothetical protein